jgi:predicted Zn finger-like uncharacterized protein
MKFLCDNCKAKYQIGDDKVAGKTVRMKCRRCGHSITVSSKVTESSVSRSLPADPNEPTLSAPPNALEDAPASGRAPRPAVAGPAPDPRPSPRAALRSDDDESTQIMQIPVAPSRPGAPPARPRPAAGAPPPPRPSGVGVSGPAALRAPAPPRPIGIVASRAPAPVRELRAPLQSVPKPAPSPPQPAVEPGGVAAAFQRAVSDPNATSSSRHPPHEDWYVGVGGQPLGPVRVDVIREKAMLGQVDGDSLVWREGFDEWQPLKKFPELLEVVHGARMQRIPAKPADVAPAPFQPRVTGIGAAAALAAPAGGVRHVPTAGSFGTQGMQAAPEPAPAPIPAPVPIPAPIVFAPIVAAPIVHAPAPSPVKAVSVLADPFAAPVAPGPTKPAPEPPAQAVVAESPFGVPAGVADKPSPFASAAPMRPSVAPPSSAEISALIPRQRAGMHPMAYAFIAMAAVFGGVAAYVLFLKPQAAPQIVVVEKTVPGAPVAGTPAGAPTGEAPAAGDATAAPSAKIAGGPAGGRTKGPAAAAQTAAPAAGPGAPAIDTSGFNNGGVGGPSAGNTPPPSAGGTLSQGEIQGVVTSNQARIKRQCWENALAARSSSAPSTVRVNGQITIGPSGNVENATASGGDSYPGLASCIQGKMKNWKFPPSGGSQTVNVPFVFAGQ